MEMSTTFWLGKDFTFFTLCVVNEVEYTVSCLLLLFVIK